MDKRTFTAFFLIFLVIMAYQFLILPKVAPPPPQAPTATSPPPPEAVEPAAAVPEGQFLPEGAAGTEEIPAATESREIPVEGSLYQAVLNTTRGGISSWKTLRYLYPETSGEVAGKPVEFMLPSSGPRALGITFTDPSLEKAFSASMALEEEGERIVLVGSDQHGLVVRRAYRFSPDSYGVEMEITFENRSETPRNLSWEILLGPDLDRFRAKGGTDKPVAMKYLNGKTDNLKVRSPGESKSVGPVSWIGIGDRYFLSALVAREGSLAGFVRKDSESRLEVGLRAESFTLLPRQVSTYRLLSYLGPKEQDRLTSYELGLEKSVNYGWFSWLAHPFLAILKFFHRYMKNWGLAIMLLTLMVKMVLFPISRTMYSSMRKMQSLQPQIQALKKKHKDDAQALQKETMELYRQYKVNPMAGCLPMVVQIPVFFALYRVLYNAIELRGAGFLYIHDLSQKDPYYITPLLMGATMILQQRLSPTTGDPKQAKMMMFMPIIFTAMFLNFSSGLVLYFLCSNVLSIGEQYLIRRGAAGLQVATVTSGTGTSKGKAVRKKKS